MLTLFGNYVGTIKGAGFYFVNPFCTSVNPASRTHLGQSSDVDKAAAAMQLAAGKNVTPGNKISMKIMTLNNGRQKVNDCLGNPIDIGVAVMWKVKDTAKYPKETGTPSRSPCMNCCLFVFCSIVSPLLIYV